MNYYVISSGSYSDYDISFIVSSPKVITAQQFDKYHLESIKRSSDFDDTQVEKLRKHLERVEIDLSKDIRSTNYYNVFYGEMFHGENRPIEISFENWGKLCNHAGVEENPDDWFEKVLKENGCEIIEYEEFNTDDWD